LTRDPEQVFPGSRIPNPYFDSFMTIFFGKKYCNLCFGFKKIIYLFKNNMIYNFMIFVATKNGRTNFSPSFSAVVGSGIRNG
jgi:hypothetical protein